MCADAGAPHRASRLTECILDFDIASGVGVTFARPFGAAPVTFARATRAALRLTID